MIILRGLPDVAPPDPRTREANIPTLLFSWWCTGCALVIILFRLVGRMVRNDMLFREDKIIFASLIPLFIRMGFVHVILLFGTNNVKQEDFTATQIYHREIGSKLVLASRIFYAMFIWMTKWCISEFLKRLTQSFWRKGYERVLRLIRFFLIATFLAVVISTLAECQPFDHYWQVTPDPGPKCRLGWAQLITSGVADTITDLVLVCFPSFIVIRSHFAWTRKFCLVCLFSLSIIPAVITLYRVPAVIAHHSRQQYRTVWASGEILAAAGVSNAIVLGSFLRDRGVKKQPKSRLNRVVSVTESTTATETSASARRATLTQQQMGSDEDLFRGMCYRPSDPEACKAMRPPIRTFSRTNSNLPRLKTSDWKFPSASDSGRDSEESDATRLGAPDRYEVMPSPGDLSSLPGHRRRVSFFDASGLMETGEAGSEEASTLAESSQSSTSVQDFGYAMSSPPTKASRVLTRETLSPIEGSPSVRPENSEGILVEDPSRRDSEIPSLQDVGGLAPPDNLSDTVSLRDIGGLLNSAPGSPNAARFDHYRPRAQSPIVERARQGSEGPSLKDVGGLLPPDNLSDTMSIQDIGGLLNSGPSSLRAPRQDRPHP